MSHSPGPWKLNVYFEDGAEEGMSYRIREVIDAAGQGIVHDQFGTSENDMRLISCAPEMLSMLKECRAWIAEDDHADIILPKLDALIAKAEVKS